MGLKLNRQMMIVNRRICVKLTSKDRLKGNSVDITRPMLHFDNGGVWHKPQNSPNRYRVNPDKQIVNNPIIALSKNLE